MLEWARGRTHTGASDRAPYMGTWVCRGLRAAIAPSRSGPFRSHLGPRISSPAAWPTEGRSHTRAMPNGGPPEPDATATKYKKSFTESKKWSTYQEEQTDDGAWKGQLSSLTWEKGKWHDGYVKEEWLWTPPITNGCGVRAPKAKAKGKAKAKAKPKAKGKAKAKARGRQANGKGKGKGKGKGGKGGN